MITVYLAGGTDVAEDDDTDIVINDHGARVITENYIHTYPWNMIRVVVEERG